MPILALLLLRRLVPRRVDQTRRRLRLVLTLWRLAPPPVRSVVHRLTSGRVGFVTGMALGAIGSRAGSRLLRRRSRRKPATLALAAGAALLVVFLVAAQYL